MCGTLHCVHLNERLEFGIESAAVQSKFYIDENDKRFTCRSAIVDLGLFTADVGQSPNGAKCGTNKVCLLLHYRVKKQMPSTFLFLTFV